MEDRLIYQKDMHEDNIESLLNRIKDNCPGLYQYLIQDFEKNASVGVRFDILNYFAEHSEEFGDDMSFLFLLSSFACNPLINVEQMDFVTGYFVRNEKDEKFSFDDFGIIFSSCIDKNIPVSHMHTLFYSDMSVPEICDAVGNFDELPADLDDVSDLSKDSEVTKIDHQVVVDVEDSKKDHSSGSDSNPSDVDMFNNLVTVLTYQDKDSIDDLNFKQNQFSDIIGKFQSSTSELSSLASSFINDMKKDKEEIQKLNAMISLMQKLLSSKQAEVNKLLNEISRLNDRIRTSEKAELRRDALNQKITEAYQLALNPAAGSDSMFCLK